MSDVDDAVRTVLGVDPAVGSQARVVICGPPGAGKSTLLARLLIDSGAAVPDWLEKAMAGEVHPGEVESGGLRYADGPGDVGPDPAADILLVAVPAGAPPEEDLLAALRPYARAGLPLVFVATQCDHQASADPPTAVVRFGGELARQLKAAGLGRAGPVLAVAADPDGASAFYGLQDAAAYAESRPWDGIDGLRTTLAGLTATGADRHRRRIALARVVAADLIEETDAQLEAATRLAATVAKLEASLTGLARDAHDALQVKLATRLIRETRDLRRTAADDLGRALADELTITLPVWRRTWEPQLADVAKGAAAVLAEELEPPATGRPVIGRVNPALGGVLATARQSPQLTLDHWIRLTKQVHTTALKEVVNLVSLARHGHRLKQLSRELIEFKKLGPTRYAETGGWLAGADHAAGVKQFTERAARTLDALSYLADGVMVILNEIAYVKRERDRFRREEELRAGAEGAAEAVTVRVLADGDPSWNAAVAAVRGALTAADPAELRDRRAELAAAAAVLDRAAEVR